MPALPIPRTAKISIDSSHADIDKLQTERTENGTLTGVSLWAAPKQTFALVIKHCSRSERDAIRDSYRNNRALALGSITFNFPRPIPSDPSITTRWVAPPSWQCIGRDRYVVTCPLEEV